jgi:hypothetical protein
MLPFEQTLNVPMTRSPDGQILEATLEAAALQFPIFNFSFASHLWTASRNTPAM